MPIHPRPVLALLVAAAALLAGCAAPGATLDPNADAAAVSFDGLEAPNAVETLDADGVRTFRFEGATKPGASVLVNAQPVPDLRETFGVDGRVGYVEASILIEPTDLLGGEALVAYVRDADNRILCGAVSVVEPPSCTAPVAGATGEQAWTIEVRPASISVNTPDVPFTVTVSLHPAEHMTLGDPLEGVDASISFRVSDTGVEGAEDNIGVLGDGAIFTQKGVNTMRSLDDGITWENVAPVENSQTTLDPMLFVDPHRGIVYIDHLYVVCSALSWSRDHGESWLTNPAACGRPVGDHQKIASGPSPIAGSPLPAVYYTYSIPGVWASRSLDGGVTWTSVPVVGATDDRIPNNTGPIFADEEGNVFIPLYMCDGDGYVGMGVSHDYGLTWKFVVVSDEPGPCYDVDPGVWTDTDGNVYMAYHRPTGVKVAVSQDHGETWGEPITVSPPSLKSFVHVDAVAGGPGRVAVVYRATPDTAKGPDAADGWAAWHLYVTFVENATSATPTVRTAIVNDPAQPVQRGSICTMGIACTGGNRNLLDFIDIAVGPDGRVYPTYTSGCKGGCPTPADSRERVGLVGVQVTGPRLFEDKAPWAT